MTVKELVSETFSPRVAVLCSKGAETICEKNNLTFTQLIQPFTTLTTDLSWQEPQGQNIISRPLRITAVDIASWKPVDFDSQKNRNILTNLVSRTPPCLYGFSNDSSPGLFKKYRLGTRTSEYEVEVPEQTPWFNVWRETFLRLHSEQQHNQHEFLHHFVACMLVISSSEAKSPEDLSTIIGKLSKLQQQHQLEWPHTWILPSVIKFYIILHDNSTEHANTAEPIYQSLRTIYGGNFCYMLKINSATEPELQEKIVPDPWASYLQDYPADNLDDMSSDVTKLYEDPVAIINTDVFHPLSPESEVSPSILPHNGEVDQNCKSQVRKRGQCLSHQDLQNIQVAINEFLGKALLPYVERQARLLHESILNRRGMSKSVFSAAKRLFGTTAKPATSVVYTPESIEMMSRKLADIYFLFGHYSGAYQFYHQIKKDFSADCAWTHYASSLEMAALSHFMMTQANPPMAQPRAFPVHYVNEAIGHYIDHCRMTDAAIRCAIVCCECLKQMENYGEAAAIFIRMTSEDCDLRSALMLEQAAYTFLQMTSPRKYALHSVLAGHRYAKAGLKSHSLNSYLQASQIYQNRGWRFAEDHVHFTIARHQCNLYMYTGISHHLKSLLFSPTPQPAHQIQIFFKEFLTVMAKLYEGDRVPHEFFIPKIISDDIVVRIAVSDLTTGEIFNYDNKKEIHQSSVMWDTLEEQIVKECVNNSVSVMHFKPSRLLFHRRTDNTVYPSVPCNETFYVEIPIQNPLSIEICLSSIVLKFDQLSNSVSCSMIDNLKMDAGETKILRFGIACTSVGMISILKMFYHIDFGVLRVPFEQNIVVKGPRLNTNKVERAGRIYAKDYRTTINIIDQMPLLQAEVENIPRVLFQAQKTYFNLHLKDRTIDSDQRKRITRIVVACENMKDFLEIRTKPDTANNFQIETKHQNFCPVKLTFDSSSHARIPCLYRVPQVGDIAHVNVLILYQFQSTVISSNASMHRVIKISIKVPLVPCLRLEYSPLKLVDAATSLALLRVHNITQSDVIHIENLEFHPSELKVEEVVFGSETLSVDDIYGKVDISPFESKNLIVKIHDQGNIEDTRRKISLGLNWHIGDLQPESTPNDHKTVGYYNLLVDENKLIPDDNSFVFQVKHVNKAANNFNDFPMEMERPVFFTAKWRIRCFQAYFPCYVFSAQLLLHPRIASKLSLSIKEAKQNESEPATNLLASSQGLFFIGKTTWILNVEPKKTISLDYKIVINRPGVYNVAPIVAVEFIETGFKQTFLLHSPIIVSHRSTES